MNMKICERGHYYDGDLNATCPQCAAEARSGGGSMMDNIGATEPVGRNAGSGFDTIGATVPLGGANPNSGFYQAPGEAGATSAPTSPFGEATMGFGGSGGFSGVDQYTPETTPVNPLNGGASGFSPVVGWLVCIDGPDRGHDYRIRAGYNHIGRAEHMDICIRGDQNVSREKAALIAYDEEENLFFFGPSDGRNIVRANGKTMMVPTEIHAYDVLTVGTTRLLFIPLCTEKFTWKD